jgi:pimeloyl-ACP methyl ester carboxylesterase
VGLGVLAAANLPAAGRRGGGGRRPAGAAALARPGVPVSRPETPAQARLATAERRLAARYRLPVAERYLDLAEPRLRVRVLEVGEGRPLLLLHGVTLLADHWAPLLAKLRGFRCIAVDLPGHGRSDPVDFRRLPLRRWYVGMLGALLDRLGLPAAPVVGHSLGGMLGLWLALDAPRRVQALMVMGAPAVALPGSHADLLLALLATPPLGRLLLGTPAPLPVYRWLLARSAGRHALASAAPEVVETSWRAARLPGVAGSVASFLERELQERHPRQGIALTGAELAGIRQPTLVIWGQDDQRFCPLPQARAAIAQIPTARLEVVPGGHQPWLDDPHHCATLLATFLGGKPTGAPPPPHQSEAHEP